MTAQALHDKRYLLHEELVAILGDGTRHVYFQPPENVKMTYPCIVYERHNINNIHANNGVYLQGCRYRVIVIDNKVKGTLKYVTGYTGFSSNVEEQSGNYLALRVDNIPTDAVVTYQHMDGHHEPVTLDEDLNIVIRVTDQVNPRKFTVTYNGSSSSKEFDLSELVLEPAPEESSNEEEVVG